MAFHRATVLTVNHHIALRLVQSLQNLLLKTLLRLYYYNYFRYNLFLRFENSDSLLRRFRLHNRRRLDHWWLLQLLFCPLHFLFQSSHSLLRFLLAQFFSLILFLRLIRNNLLRFVTHLYLPNLLSHLFVLILLFLFESGLLNFDFF